MSGVSSLLCLAEFFFFLVFFFPSVPSPRVSSGLHRSKRMMSMSLYQFCHAVTNFTRCFVCYLHLTSFCLCASREGIRPRSFLPKSIFAVRRFFASFISLSGGLSQGSWKASGGALTGQWQIVPIGSFSLLFCGVPSFFAPFCN